MNQELQQALTKFVEMGIEATGVIEQVGREQLPLVLQEYLKWGIVKNLYLLVVSLLIAIAILVLARIVDRHERRVDEELIVLGRIITVLAVVPLINVMILLRNVLQIYVAPRVYLIEQLKELVK